VAATTIADKRTVGLWSQYEPQLTGGFFGFEPLRPYLIETAFGPEAATRHAGNRWWAEDIVCELYLRERAAPVRSMVSLCCGFGAVEQHLVASLGTVEHCLALDVAPGAVDEARRRAREAGLGDVIEYEVADLNACNWRGKGYDLVVANGALHHLAQVEDVLDCVVAKLAPGGILYANEHIGAAYRHFAPRQLELINALAYLVPPDMRRRRPMRANPFLHRPLRHVADAFLGNLDLAGSDRARWSPAKRAVADLARLVTLPPRRGFGPLVLSQRTHLLATDPSEGVASDRIVPGIRARLADVRLHPYGGGALAYALDRGFYEGYEPDNPAHVRLLQTLCELERWLVDTGQLPDEHAIVVAVKH
jgi:SAM-dependent methyltransferase